MKINDFKIKSDQKHNLIDSKKELKKEQAKQSLLSDIAISQMSRSSSIHFQRKKDNAGSLFDAGASVSHFESVLESALEDPETMSSFRN